MLQCHGLRKTYGAFVALDGVNLDVEGEELVGLAGPNGAGKTTLLDAISGRLPLTSGTIKFQGQDIAHMGASRRSSRGIGRSFQSPLVPAALTLDAAFRAAELAYSPHPSKTRIDQVRAMVGPDVPGDTLCGGLNTLDRRRLQLAASAIRDPRLLLLDEPCSGLFSDEIAVFESLVREVAKSINAAVIVVEHRLELLYSLTPRVLVLAAGRPIADGSPEDVFERPEVRAAYFEAPEPKQQT